MEVAGPAPCEGFVRVRSVDVDLGLRMYRPPFICQGKPGGDRGGWWSLPALFAFKLQITRKPNGGSEKSLALPMLPD